MSEKSRVVYIHTLDGQPAEYDPGEQVCYLGRNPLTRFARSLRQLRREQQASVAWRWANGMDGGYAVLGYFRLRLP